MTKYLLLIEVETNENIVTVRAAYDLALKPHPARLLNIATEDSEFAKLWWEYYKSVEQRGQP
jgi:hypothetical protein